MSENPLYMSPSLLNTKRPQYNQVVFHDIFDSYLTDCDLYISYTVTDTFKPMDGDLICIYPVAWKDTSQYVVSVPAPTILNEEPGSCIKLRTSIPTEKLPKSITDLYQLCYLTVDKKVVGLYGPFNFRHPAESDYHCVEDKNNTGLIIYKSRAAILHDKIAVLENVKEENELKIFTLNGKISILEKELSSTTSVNKDLSEELKNAKEDVNLLTENLKRLNNEYNDLQTKIKQLQVQSEEAELNKRRLLDQVSSKEEELKNKEQELHIVKQEQVRVQLTLDEISHYNTRLKRDVDSLMQEKESLHESERSLKEKAEQMEKTLQEVAITNKTQQDVVESPPNAEMDHPGGSEDLKAQLSEALHLLDEALQNQSPTNEERERYIRELEDRLKNVTEEQLNNLQEKDLKICTLESKILLLDEEKKKLSERETYIIELENEIKLLKDKCKGTENNIHLENTIAKQYEEIRNMSDELIQLKSSSGNISQKETEYMNNIKTLNQAKEDAYQMNKSISLRLQSLENELLNCKNESEVEINSYKSKISELQKMSEKAEKVNELETIIKCLKEAVVKQPSLDEFCQLIFESTRVTAMESYKELFDSVTFIEFDNPEVGFKVRRLLDEFGLLKQDLERCLLENRTMYKELDEFKISYRKIEEENESNKSRVVELNETVSELRNCLDAVKKDSNDAQQLKEIKDELENIKKTKDSLEKQLKETRIANALTSIGRVTMEESSLLTEVEQLRSRIQDLESQNNTSSSCQKCCIKMQEQLKRSAKEYAKLYHQLQTEREQYHKLLSSISSFQQLPSSVIATPLADPDHQLPKSSDTSAAVSKNVGA